MSDLSEVREMYLAEVNRAEKAEAELAALRIADERRTVALAGAKDWARVASRRRRPMDSTVAFQFKSTPHNLGFRITATRDGSGVGTIEVPDAKLDGQGITRAAVRALYRGLTDDCGEVDIARRRLKSEIEAHGATKRKLEKLMAHFDTRRNG